MQCFSPSMLWFVPHVYHLQTDPEFENNSNPRPELNSSTFSGLPFSLTGALNIDLWALRLDSRINDVGYVGILWGAISWHLFRLRLNTTPSFGPEAIKALKRDEVIFERTWKKSSIMFWTSALGEPFGLYLALKNSWNETPWYGLSCLKLLVFELLHSHCHSHSRSDDIDLSLSVLAAGL